jgi:chromosome segregation ATPase
MSKDEPSSLNKQDQASRESLPLPIELAVRLQSLTEQVTSLGGELRKLQLEHEVTQRRIQDQSEALKEFRKENADLKKKVKNLDQDLSDFENNLPTKATREGSDQSHDASLGSASVYGRESSFETEGNRRT